MRVRPESTRSTGQKEGFVDEEIFLLPPQVGPYTLHLLVEIFRHAGGRLVDGPDGAEQRGFVVEGLPGIADENGRYAERRLTDESR